MTNLYLDPIKTTGVEPDVVASAKGFVVPQAVGSVKSSEKSDSGTISLDNSRSDKTLGQSSMNVTDKDNVDKSIHVLISKILNAEPKSDVVSDVTTSLTQTDHPIETSLEKSDGKYDSEFVPIKSLEKSEEKDDSDSMSVDMSDKEENFGVKKDQSTNIVNVDDLDSNDDPIGKVVKSTSKPPKALKKSTSVGPAKGWRKVVTPATKKISLKRKEVPYSYIDSEYDVENNVQDITPLKKVVGKKVPVNVLEVPIDNISFHSVENVEKWKYVYQRRLDLERELGKDALECKEVVSLIENVGLMKSVAGFGKCYKILLKEFIVNIYKDCDNKRSKEFRKVYVRGKCVEFSPEIINRIGAANWILTNHTSTIVIGLGKFIYTVETKTKFDFGSYVFEQTLKHASTFVVKMPIAFPSLICGIILSQHPVILISSNATSKREFPLFLHYRLFAGTHVPGVVMTYGNKSSSFTSRTRIIAELKDTCKTLDETIKAYTEKKSMLEVLINALSEEDAEGNIEGDKEEYNEVEEDVDASGDDVEETTNNNDDWCDLFSLWFFFMLLLHLWAIP
ncbi:uncharacterized protein LOC127095256 [Lathyrus oleraceus]|uniref:uncharacterized protein LOC127095256 n=1 Tax=Pisum sativum TaxID=3888 RepID=UPI0021CEF278|nr:uncharacterized protein LOC127095256 [Pisum sativum]